MADGEGALGIVKDIAVGIKKDAVAQATAGEPKVYAPSKEQFKNAAMSVVPVPESPTIDINKMKAQKAPGERNAYARALRTVQNQMREQARIRQIEESRKQEPVQAPSAPSIETRQKQENIGLTAQIRGRSAEHGKQRKG